MSHVKRNTVSFAGRAIIFLVSLVFSQEGFCIWATPRETLETLPIELRKLSCDFSNVVVFIAEYADGGSDDDDGVEGGGEGSQ